MARPSQRDEFLATIKTTLAKRAGNHCSNPTCRASTSGPDPSAPDRALSTGRAAHICAASPGGPRYDPSQSPAERRSIHNAIHLCITCADLVDQNGGTSATAEALRKWKLDREAEAEMAHSLRRAAGSISDNGAICGTVYEWLSAHTSEIRGKSHRTIQEIADGAGLTEDQVRAACRSHSQIFPSQSQPGSWSIFPSEPKSVYERRGVRIF